MRVWAADGSRVRDARQVRQILEIAGRPGDLLSNVNSRALDLGGLSGAGPRCFGGHGDLPTSALLESARIIAPEWRGVLEPATNWGCVCASKSRSQFRRRWPRSGISSGRP